jgi:hypothetical protein
MTAKDMTGMRFGRLTVLRRDGYAQGQRVYAWRCRCDCGNEKTVGGPSLRKGYTVSCGCLRLERLREALVTHGHCPKEGRSAEYTAWAAMIKRCTNPMPKEQKAYGHVKVCERWRQSFEAFLADMGYKPTPKHTLDRWPDNTGNYEPKNCRWATRVEQSRNRTTTVKDGGVPLAQLADDHGLNYSTVRDRRRRGATGERLIRPKEYRGVR